jgi:type III pantothenate kinase
LCNAVAAYKLHGGPSLVVDLGTATTFDAVDKNGYYVGSAIAPGMQISHKALIDQTAILKEVPLEAPKSVIGTDTTTAIQSGVVLGYVDLVEGMIKRFKKEMGEETKIIFTGGLSPIVSQYTSILVTVDQNLTLKGIQIITAKNQQ